MNLEQIQSLLQQALDYYESKINFILMILQKDQNEVADFERKKALKELKTLVSVVGNLDSALSSLAKAIEALEKQEFPVFS